MYSRACSLRVPALLSRARCEAMARDAVRNHPILKACRTAQSSPVCRTVQSPEWWACSIACRVGGGDRANSSDAIARRIHHQPNRISTSPPTPGDKTKIKTICDPAACRCSGDSFRSQEGGWTTRAHAVGSTTFSSRVGRVRGRGQAAPNQLQPGGISERKLNPLPPFSLPLPLPTFASSLYPPPTLSFFPSASPPPPP
jgi:hypothetical protein